ncbi:hypothetical protein SDJN02_03678, partial [Cucurbita argyrosperma subsp. argyrosperma]
MAPNLSHFQVVAPVTWADWAEEFGGGGTSICIGLHADSYESQKRVTTGCCGRACGDASIAIPLSATL